ncbi:MAG: serine/threonine-protein kinase [Planctomycetota bacterium]
MSEDPPHPQPPASGTDPQADHALDEDDTVLIMPTDDAPKKPATPSRDPGNDTDQLLGLDVCSIWDDERIVDADRIVASLVVERALCTREEVARCQGIMDRGVAKSLAEVLIKEGFATRTQIDRLAPAIDAANAGDRIPGFRLIEKIGKGAAATVFKAEQRSLDRMVAVKVMPKKWSSDSFFIERFYAEGRAAAKLNHPNIVQAIDVGFASGFHFFVMEYVPGQTVYDLTMSTGTVEEEEALGIIASVADGLRHAHERGLVHRDVKPKNIIMAERGLPKLADLGLARHVEDHEAAAAEAGQAYGTPYYMSPEQTLGEKEIGPASDIYSLGATCYHMLTGRVPFDGTSAEEVFHKHREHDLTPPHRANPNVTEGVSEVVTKMMAKRAHERFTDCNELLGELRAWQSYHVLRRGESDSHPRQQPTNSERTA